MTLKVRCEQCGKVSQFSPSDAGMTALCVACGARFVIPVGNASDTVIPDAALLDASPTDSLVDFVPAQTVAAAAAPASVAASVASPEPTPSAAAQAQPDTATTARRGINYPLLYALLGSAITLAIVLSAVFILSTKPTWEQRNRVMVRDLKAKAEGLAVARKFQESYDTYRKIDELVKGHDVEDPKLRTELDRARGDRDEVFKLLLSQVKDGTTAAPVVEAPRTPVSTTRVAVVVPDDVAEAPSTQSAPAHDWPEYQPRKMAFLAPPGTTKATMGERPAAMQVGPGRVVTSEAATRPSAVETPKHPATTQATAAGRGGDSRAVARLNIQRHGEAQTGLTDEAIGQSIQRGVNFLIAQFQDGQLHGGEIRNDTYHTGLNALCVYALLQSSFAIKDERLNLKGPFVRQLIDRMKAMPADTGTVTYARGIRATALALLARPEDKSALAKDVMYLLQSHIDGAYTYQAPPRGGSSPGRRGMPGGWDNSNSQYGLLGVWSAAEIGAEVNSTYWAAVENHWTRCQLADGSWDYSGYGRSRGNGRISMSVAGVASLFVTHDYLDAPRIGGQVGREPFSPALAKGLRYLETGDNSVNLDGGYTLYGLERAGLASGFKYFGTHDWYRELAAGVIRTQEADGSWGGEIETAYHLLFLARGRHPILMNKLRYDGYWANRPRDLANLARFGSKEMERPLNWQVVPITRDWTDWTDSPILSISTHTSMTFTPAELDKIRNFVDAGGLLFTQADGGKAEANKWAADLAKSLFPLYEMKDLDDSHEIFSILYKPSPRPVLRGVSNGARLLMVHSPTDITQYWQMRQDKTRRSLFELGMNLYLYATGKGDLRNRLTSSYIADQGTARGGTVKVLRLKYAGNWDPEPVAWGRFGRYFQRETDVALNVTAIDLAKLDFKLAPFAHWTGTDAYTPTAAEVAAIRAYVQAGGLLLIEPCGGSGEFYDSARQALLKAFPESRGQMMPKTHPMFNALGPGMDDLSTPLVRKYVKAKNLGTSGRLDELRSGKGAVIYNPLDITSGLLGTNTWGISGFEPSYASALMKNIVLWSVSEMKDE
jgi:hypothetical protein